MADKPKPETAPAAPADPYANLTAEPVDTLFTGGGRPAKPVPPSIAALVVQSYNSGDPKPLRVPVADKDAAEALSKLLRKAGTQHEPALTVRCTTEADGKGVRFKAGAKINRAENATPAAPAKTADAKPDAA